MFFKLFVKFSINMGHCNNNNNNNNNNKCFLY